VIGSDPETLRIFLVDGLLPAPSFDQPPPKLKQPDLARTLRRIAADGAGAFYTGEIADRIVGHVRLLGGILSADDLADYQPVVLEPLVLPYRDLELVLLPYQAGGPTTGEVLTILDGFDLRALGHNSAAALHLIAEASRHASADRHAYIGDPDFVADVLAVHMRAFGIDGRTPLDSASLTARLRPQAVLPAWNHNNKVSRISTRRSRRRAHGNASSSRNQQGSHSQTRSPPPRLLCPEGQGPIQRGAIRSCAPPEE
jgi:hypothetical protein